MPVRVSSSDEVVDHLVVQRVELLALPRSALRWFSSAWMCSAWISGFGLKNSFRSGLSSVRSQRIGAAVRLVERRPPRTRSSAAAARRSPTPAELLEQIRAHALRIEELLELDVGQLADLVFGVVDAALLADARADLPHDLLDVDVVGAD